MVAGRSDLLRKDCGLPCRSDGALIPVVVCRHTVDEAFRIKLTLHLGWAASGAGRGQTTLT